MNDGFEARFQDALTTLVNSRTPETDDVRATALNTLSDLILESEQAGERQIPNHFAELMLALLPKVSPHSRETIARRLAPCGLLTDEIVRAFLAETSEIAGPILRQSPLISVDHMLEIATGDCDEKARTVASRPDLTADVIHALIDRKDPVAGASLALSQSPLIDDAIAERIAAIPNLPRVAARRLVELADLSDEALAGLFWLVEDHARRGIIERIVERRSEPRIAADPEADAELGDALFALAAAGDRAEIASRLAAALSLPRAMGARIVSDLKGDALTVAARAAGVSPDRVTGIVLLTVTEAGQSYDVLRTLAGLAASLTTETARYIVALWSVHGLVDRRPARHVPAVARPSERALRPGASEPRRLDDLVADITRRTGS